MTKFQRIRKFDWGTYASANFVPKNIREDFFAVHWFYHELSRAVESTKETALGMGKLDFWTDSVNKIFEVVVDLFKISFRIILSKNLFQYACIMLAKINHFLKDFSCVLSMPK